MCVTFCRGTIMLACPILTTEVDLRTELIKHL